MEGAREVGGWGGYIHTQITCQCCWPKTFVPQMRWEYIHLRSILPQGRAPIAMVQSWVSRGGCGVVSTLNAYKLTQEGQEAASRCAARAWRAAAAPHDHHRHREGVWEDDQPHPVTREQSEVKIIVTTNRAEGQAIGHNKRWIQQSGASQQGEGTRDKDADLTAEEKCDRRYTE